MTEDAWLDLLNRYTAGRIDGTLPQGSLLHDEINAQLAKMYRDEDPQYRSWCMDYELRLDRISWTLRGDFPI